MDRNFECTSKMHQNLQAEEDKAVHKILEMDFINQKSTYIKTYFIRETKAICKRSSDRSRIYVCDSDVVRGQ